MSAQGETGGARVVIAGGGVTGVEALLALHDLAPARTQVTLLAPDPDFVYKPLLVEEPFGLGPPEQRALGPLAEELGARFELGAASAVRPADQVLELAGGAAIEYDYLIVCIGARYVPALPGARTFPSPSRPFRVDEALEAANGEPIAFVVPPGVTWALPIYELALMTQRRAVERGQGVRVIVLTPEDAPLAVFGPTASQAVAELLRARGIEVETGSHVRSLEDGELVVAPGDRRLRAGEVVALPTMRGPALDGLPADGDGFIPIDDHARVRGVDAVYAAGDGTNFPIKQGGVGTQQADAAAADVAHRLGALAEAEPFHPVLRGKLITGGESLHLRTDVGGGAGEGESSLDCLWWPPQKVSGRYLAPWLYHGEAGAEPEPPSPPLEVEVALPREWHEEPMAIDLDGPPEID